VVAYVEVPDFGKRPLALSGLLVERRTPGQGGGGMPVSILTERTFRPADVLKVTGALYTRRNVPIDRVLLDAEVRDAAGTAVVTRSFAARAWPAGAVDDRPFDVDVPLSPLMPGRYLLRVTAYVRGNGTRRPVS
jgi:hypothetical protein